jgi:hypothetical protein
VILRILIRGNETSDLLFVRIIVRLIIYEIDILVMRFIIYDIEFYNLWY